MEVKAAPIVQWIQGNVPPLTWTTIKLKYMSVFIDAKISPSKIDDSTMFNPQLISCINETLRDKFNKEIPVYLTTTLM